MSQMGATVILPTYNERENIHGMLQAILALPDKLSILVVDDNSPDGTGALVDAWAERYPNIRALHRRDERGLGSAYVAGFRQAISDGADRLVTMDCDFSHDPADIPRLLEAADNADLVIGSRYVAGGKTRNWPLARKLISRSANLYARAALDLEVRDCTAGFRAYSSDLMRRMLAAGIKSTGYTIQVELVALAAHRFKARVQEVPITFSDRERGQSKISRSEVTHGLAAVLNIRQRLNTPPAITVVGHQARPAA